MFIFRCFALLLARNAHSHLWEIFGGFWWSILTIATTTLCALLFISTFSSLQIVLFDVVVILFFLIEKLKIGKYLLAKSSGLLFWKK